MMLKVPVVLAYFLLAAVPACSRRPAPAAHSASPRQPAAAEMGWLVPGLSSAGNSFILAWNRHDARALAALWHEGGDLVDAAGRAARGRAQIETLLRDELGQSRLDFLSGATESAVGRDVRLEDWDVEIAGAPPALAFASPTRLHLFLVYSRRPPRRSAADPEPSAVAEGPRADEEPPYRADDGWLLASARAYAFQGGGLIDDMSEHGEPLRVRGAVTRPEPISTPPPAYTGAARRAGIEGIVLIEAVVDRNGSVAASRVLKTLPLGLEAKAREAVERWQFKPATLHGRPVAVYDTLTVHFSLPHAPRAEDGSGPP